MQFERRKRCRRRDIRKLTGIQMNNHTLKYGIRFPSINCTLETGSKAYSVYAILLSARLKYVSIRFSRLSFDAGVLEITLICVEPDPVPRDAPYQKLRCPLTIILEYHVQS